jgi:hypothetical protein
MPHWNYALLAAAIILSVVPAAAIMIGIFISYRQSNRRETWTITFLMTSIGVYLLALIHLYATNPIYSTVKASYTMGLTPCYAAMAAAGAGLLFSNKRLRSIFIALTVTWGIVNYAGFFLI